MKYLSVFFSFFCIIFYYGAVHAETARYDGIIHVHTPFSHGKYTLEQISQKAQHEGIRIIIPADSLINRWEYYPFTEYGILKKTVELTSVLSIGAQAYLDAIQYCRTQFPEMVIIPGVEITPHYYWKGSFWEKTLTLHQSNKHVMVIGITDAQVYAHMPVLSNPYGKTWQWISVFPFSPVLPVKKYLYDASHEALYKEKPYQELIDYAAQKGGLVFWAHPDSEDYTKSRAVGELHVQSDPYAESIVKTKDHNGFAFFSQGGKTGSIGGYWDKALALYCEGNRKNPAWAIGELDTVESLSDKHPFNVKNIFFIEAVSEQQVLQALRNGSFYSTVRAHTHELILEEYYVTDGINRAYSGETLRAQEGLKLYLSISTDDKKKRGILTYVISGGKEIMKKKLIVPCKVLLPISLMPAKKTYVRVDIIEDESSRIVSNPIFIEPK